MPKISYVVLSEEVMKSSELNKSVLVEPINNIDVPEFPHTLSVVGSVGLFNLDPGVTYNFGAFIYSPTGEKIDGSIFEIQTAEEGESIDLSFVINFQDIVFTMTGPHHFRFQITNLHEEKSTFFYVKQKRPGEDNE